MSEQKNTFSDVFIGGTSVDYDGETLRQFDEYNKLQFEKKMTFEEAYGYYQSLRRSLKVQDLSIEEYELNQDKLDKISRSLEKELNALRELKKYTGRFSVGNYIKGGEFISIHFKGTDIKRKVATFEVKNGKFIGQEYNKLGGNKVFNSIDEITSFIERIIPDHEIKIKQEKLEKTANNVLSDPDINSKLEISYAFPGLVNFKLRDVFKEKYQLNESKLVSFEVYSDPDGSMKVEIVGWEMLLDSPRISTFVMTESNSWWVGLDVWMKSEINQRLQKLDKQH